MFLRRAIGPLDRLGILGIFIYSRRRWSNSDLFACLVLAVCLAV